MKNKINKVLRPISIALLMGLTAGICTTVYAQEDDKTKVLHQVIQLSASSDKPSIIEIEENGEVEIIELSTDEIQDNELLMNKLSSLDEDTRETVLNIIEQKGSSSRNHLAFINTENEASFTLDGLHNGIDFDGETEIVVLEKGQEVEFKGLLKGHKTAIIKLIEKGDFTIDELNEIQKVLDAKY